LPLFTADFLADTMHLSAQETGAYLCLMMVAWQTPECRLPDNDKKLSQWARVDAKTWRAIKAEVMAFWVLADGSWTQKRLAKERQHVAQVSEKRRAAIRKRWGYKSNTSEYSNGIHPHLNPHSHPEEEHSRGAAPPDRGGVPNGRLNGGEEGFRACEADPLSYWPDGGDA
jgi:uncharacterized protein YdaU (DUF1376 family)